MENDTAGLISFLKIIPLFSSVPHGQLQDIAKHFEPVFLKQEQFVYRRGSPSDSMYIISSGSVGIYLSNGSNELFINDLHRGDCFGETDLLTGRCRESSIKVILDSKLFRLGRNDLEKIIKENPSIGLYLTRYYARRCALSSRNARDESLPTSFAMTATHKGLGRSHFLYSLAYHLSSEAKKNVLIVELGQKNSTGLKLDNYRQASCPDQFINYFPNKLIPAIDKAWHCHESGFMVFHPMDDLKDEFKDNIEIFIDRLGGRYHFIFYNLPQNDENIDRDILPFCDRILLLINNTKEAMGSVRSKIELTERLCKDKLGIIRVGVSHLMGKKGVARDLIKKKLNLPETPAIWVDTTPSALAGELDTQKCFPVRGPRALARELGRIRVGLSLGAGAARGWAHLGVLKVLEEESIHIDMIAGTSMGALVGAVYASTACVNSTKKLTIDLALTRRMVKKGFYDYTFPFQGMLRGQKFLKVVDKIVNGADFLDLLIPTSVVAVDIFRGEEVILDRGRVCKAVRASSSLPGIFNPFYHDKRWFVDGGLVNPVPVNVLVQKGADIIIAVCIEQENDRKTVPGKPFPSIFGVLSQTVKIMHTRAKGDFASQADIAIYPNVNDFAWDDFHHGHNIMGIGEDSCRKHISEIKQIISQRWNT